MVKHQVYNIFTLLMHAVFVTIQIVTYIPVVDKFVKISLYYVRYCLWQVVKVIYHPV